MKQSENQAAAKAALRRAAEARLKSKSSTQPAPTPADQLRLQHELEVHQIELEMQNEELRQSQAKVEAGLERYSDLFDFAPVGYLDLIADGTISLANLAGAKLVGLDRAELKGRHFQTFVAEEDRLVFSDFLRRVFGTQTRQSCDITLARKDQTRLQAHVEGTVTGESCHAAIFDITDRIRLAAEKERLTARTVQLQKSESLGRMAGAIAHNFNNQLQVVIMNLELAQHDLPPNANLGEALGAAHKAADISAQMLTYLGQSHLERKTQDLSEVCRQCLPLLRAALPRTVVLEADLPAPGPVVSANASQLHQVLTNLLANAFEATREGTGNLRLAVKPAPAASLPAKNRFPVDWQPRDPDYACLEVADSGCGIAAGDIGKLCDPFYTSKETGRGLGLAVVLGILRAHGGCLTVESQPGRGSVFRVFLPVTAAAAPRQPAPAVAAPKADGRGAVLVVEDELALRSTVTRALQRTGFKVFAAADGVEGVALFEQHRDEIRCVLCDLTMPRMGGWETLAALRRLAPGLPVILSSGYDDSAVMEGQHAELPQAFLHKPYELQALLSLVKRLLGVVQVPRAS